jgi:flagellar biosynthesis protein
MKDEERQAVGLSYQPDSEAAPRVVAKGKGELAERLLAIAEEHGVPIKRDPDLLQFLTATQVGEEVPEEVYAAVAALIAFLWRLNDGLAEPSTGQ